MNTFNTRIRNTTANISNRDDTIHSSSDYTQDDYEDHDHDEAFDAVIKVKIGMETETNKVP